LSQITYLADPEPEVVVEGGRGEQDLPEAGCGADGALVEVDPLAPEMATPCSASFHHLYPGTPSLGTPGAMSPSLDTFSTGVIRDTRSAARCAAGSFVLQNGSPLDGDDGPHEKGGARAAASAGTKTNRRPSAATSVAMPGLLSWMEEEDAMAGIEKQSGGGVIHPTIRDEGQEWEA
jgi:hypothetical protein